MFAGGSAGRHSRSSFKKSPEKPIAQSKTSLARNIRTIRHFSIPMPSSGWPNLSDPTAATTCRGPGQLSCRPPPKKCSRHQVCNKYGIKVKPISTGWYHWAAPMKDDEPTVQFDLRRMDKIIEIDEKNMLRHRRALRHLRSTPSGSHEARTEYQHHRRRLLDIHRRQRLRILRRRAVQLLHGQQLRQSARPGVGDARRRDRFAPDRSAQTAAGSAPKARARARVA